MPLMSLLEKDSLRFTGIEAFNASLSGLLLHFASESRIVVVFNVVIGAPWKMLRNFRPLVAIDSMVFQDKGILFFSPTILLNLRIQMVVPPKKSNYEQILIEGL